MSSTWVRFVLALTLVAGGATGCGKKGKKGGVSSLASFGKKPAKGEAPQGDEAAEAAADDEAASGGGAAKTRRARGGSGGRAAGASVEAARRFAAWAPLHAFLGVPVVNGAPVSATEAIVFTRDNHVGITSDGGASWGFTRFTTGSVRAVAGAAGGPFVAVGAGGFVARSADGKTWTDLPRYTGQELVAAAVSGGAIAAVGKDGAFVLIPAKGEATVTVLPDKVKAAAVRLDGDHVVVWAGKKALESSDGVTFTPTTPPVLAAAGGWPTSRGLCAIGKVGKRKGVVCTVSGTAYGLGQGQLVVIGKTAVSVSRDAGNTWATAPLPLKGVKGAAGGGGTFHVHDGKGGVATSSDGGRTWAAGDPASLEGAPEYPKPEACDGALPEAGVACQLVRVATTPETLPDVRGLRYQGDVGLAWGDSAMVAMTSDGGATWSAGSGFGLGGLQGMDVEGDRVVIVGKARVAVSTDAGKSFRAVDLPPKTPPLFSATITPAGAVYLPGRAGTILFSTGALDSFVRMDTGPKNRTDYVYVHRVGEVLYAAGLRGELHRSDDDGRTWVPVATGLGEVVQKMAGEGEQVWALTLAGRYGGNKLLRSDDGGRHFFVQRELSDTGTVHEFVVEGGVLRCDNLVSSDAGATWTRGSDWYWPRSVDVADGSGVRLANESSLYGKDRFYVVGPEKDDYTIVESAFTKGAWFRCDRASGCWMVAAGQVYRPR